MGILGDLFGTQSKYSSELRSLPREDIRVVVSRSQVRTLNAKEETLIEDAIESERNNGRISMRKIDEILRAFVSKNDISINDKAGVLKQFDAYFEKKK